MCTGGLTYTFIPTRTWVQESFNGAKTWVKELQRRGDPNVVIALAGNKADLEARRQVKREVAEDFATENELFYVETSAKKSTNVLELFTEIARRLPKVRVA